MQFLQSEKDTYSLFGYYWLELAECYYELGDYQNMLDCVSTYEQLQVDIFRKDYYLARIMPTAIMAASELYPAEEYIPVAERYLDILVANTENNEWALRYFAALTYADLYAQSQNVAYLDAAFDLVLNNVNVLAEEQNRINGKYLSDVQLVEIPIYAGLAERNRITAYNESLTENHARGLPAVYEPLLLNCDLLFELTQTRGLTEMEMTTIEGILQGNKTPVFLTEPILNRYSFYDKVTNVEAVFRRAELILPVRCLSEKSLIRVIVTEGGEETVYEDWEVRSVDRPENDVSSFTACLVSPSMALQKWSANSKVRVEIYDEADSEYAPIVICFVVSKYEKILFYETFTFEQVPVYM